MCKHIPIEEIYHIPMARIFVNKLNFIFYKIAMLKKDLFLFFLFFCFFLQQKNILCSYKECSLLTDDIRILSYCKNESKCFIKNFNNSEYSSITCICKKYLNESFFAGPDCSI
ncbi:hypothetical protein PFMC_06084, partial [Plasmodium falciparum CAMP/Malaysia]